MKKKILVLLGLVVLAFVTGCTDPLTRLIKKNKYAPIVPIPEIQHVGDIYRTTDLYRPPVILMRDVFTEEQNKKFMESLKGPVILPVSSGEQKFELKVEADVIGYAKTELSAFNVKKFKIKINGAYQYIISEDRFERELYPMIREKRPNKDFSGNYVVLGLLQATGVEYELISERGTKIVVEPGSEIEKVVKAKLGAEWKANKNYNLSISNPSYIGYRIGKMNEVDFDPDSVIPFVILFSGELAAAGVNKLHYKPIIGVEEISPKELRKVQKARSIN